MNILSQYRFLLLLPNAHPSRTNETHTVPPKTFFFLLTKRGNKDRKKVKTTSSTMNTEEKKSIGQIVSTKSQDKKNSIPISNKIPSYTHPCLSDQ